MDDADTPSSGAGLVDLRHIDRVSNVAVFQVIADLLCRHHGAVILCFRCGRSQMRCADDPRLAQQCLTREIGHIGADLSGLHRFQQSIVVYQLAPGII